MRRKGYIEFLVQWNEILFILAIFIVSSGIVVLLWYSLAYINKNKPKSKYDWASKWEIVSLRVANACLFLALILALNIQLHRIVALSIYWFIARFLLSAALGIIAFYVIDMLIKVSYSRLLIQRLKKLRYARRISPVSGEPLQLLSEDEEDAYLDEGMQAEESAFTVDYDVWVDPASDYTQIEKYRIGQAALQCAQCLYFTLKLFREVVTLAPTTKNKGQVVRIYRCLYCENIEKRSQDLAPLKKKLEKA